MSIDPKAVAAYVTDHPTAAALGLAFVLLVLSIVWLTGRSIVKAVKRKLKDKQPEDILTFLVAGLCTAISAQGMFKFFSDKLAMPWWMQWLGFCVFEIAQVTFALRARRQIKDEESGGAGINGVLVWVMATISALLAATDASGWGAIARMIFPFVAAVTWELGLSIERRRTGKRTIQWTVGLERLAVRLGLAEATHRSVGEVDTHRRLNAAAVSAYKLDLLQRTSRWKWRVTRASRRQHDAMRELMAATDFASNPAMQDELRTMIAILKGAATLASIDDAPPWQRQDPVAAVFDTARVRFAPLIAGVPMNGTDGPPELTAGTGTETSTENRPDDISGTGTEGPSKTGTEGESSTGTETGSGTAKKTGTRRGKRTGTGTGTRKSGPADRSALLARARKLNEAHLREHGKPISGDKLAAELRVNKTKALALRNEACRPRAVPDDGVA